MMVVFQWLFCVLLSVGMVAFGLRKAHKDLFWVGKHIPALTLLTFCLSVITLYAGTKYPQEHVDVGLDLRITSTSPNSVDLAWTRRDGSNSVGRIYYVERRFGNNWIVERTITGETACSVSGFYIDRDTEWRIREAAQ